MSSDVEDGSTTLQERVAELERENHELRRQTTILESRLDSILSRIDRIETYLTGEPSTISDDYLDQHKSLEAQLEQERKIRSTHDSRIERRVGKIADNTDTDLSDTTVAGQDKITRLLRNGPGDITDTVYPVHRRARLVLEHAGEWGTVTEDTFGKRITFQSPEIRERLELKRDESLQSKQVRDVFEKIVELASDSPRTATIKKAENGVNKLKIHLEDG